MIMGPVALAAIYIGISISTTVLQFIANEISEKDRQQYEELIKQVNSKRADYSAIHERFQSETEKIKKEHQINMNDALERLQEQLDLQEQAYRDQQLLREGYRKRQQQASDSFLQTEQHRLDQESRNKAAELLQQMGELLTRNSQMYLDNTCATIEEIKEVLTKLRNYKTQQCTKIRKYSLQLLEQELRIGLNKAHAYKDYLQRYQSIVRHLCEEQSDDS